MPNVKPLTLNMDSQSGNVISMTVGTSWSLAQWITQSSFGISQSQNKAVSLSEDMLTLLTLCSGSHTQACLSPVQAIRPSHFGISGPIFVCRHSTAITTRSTPWSSIFVETWLCPETATESIKYGTSEWSKKHVNLTLVSQAPTAPSLIKVTNMLSLLTRTPPSRCSTWRLMRRRMS